jgi:type IV pilus assembly protein PilA
MFIRKKKGFTLIELMIVIAIIGILAGMALPRFSKAREEAKKKTCWGNSKNLEAAIEMVNMESSTGDTIKVGEGKVDLTGDGDQSAIMDYLAGGKFPTCTSGGKYAYDGNKGVVCNIHGNANNPPEGE